MTEASRVETRTSDTLVVRWAVSRMLLRSLGFLAFAAAVYFLDLLGSWSRNVAVVIVVFAVLTALSAITLGRRPPVLELAANGLVVSGKSPRIPWSDIRTLAVKRSRPVWMSWPRASFGEVVAFIGVEPDRLPSTGSESTDFEGPVHQMRMRKYGTNLVVTPTLLTATADEIISAATRFGHVPTQGEPQRRAPARHIVLAAAGLVVLGLLVGLITGLHE